MHTLLLTDDWDLTLDSAGDIATTTGAYSIAQNVANAVRLFTVDAWFNPERGIPHFAIDLARMPALSVFRSRVLAAARGVDGVADAAVTITGVNERNERLLTGEITIRTTTGETANVSTI